MKRSNNYYCTYCTNIDRNLGKRLRTRGLTFVEIMVGITILAVIFTAVLSLATASVTASIFNEDEARVEHEANRALQRITSIARKVGWTTQGGTTFPEVAAGGEEFRFVVLADADGNGYPFSQTTGELEWNPEIFTMKTDPDGVLAVFDDNNVPVWTIARNVASVVFTTYLQDPTLEMRALRVVVTTSRDTVRHDTLTSVKTGTIHMRN